LILQTKGATTIQFKGRKLSDRLTFVKCVGANFFRKVLRFRAIWRYITDSQTGMRSGM